MKNIVGSLILVFSSITVCKAQKVFSVNYENQADVKVFVVDYENQADLLVYKVNYENQAGKNNVQEYLSEEILKIPYYVFNNTISLVKVNPSQILPNHIF